MTLFNRDVPKISKEQENRRNSLDAIFAQQEIGIECTIDKRMYEN